jgi:hypothetical protein
MKRIFEGNPKDFWVNDDVYDEFAEVLRTWEEQERERVNFLKQKLKTEGIIGKYRNIIGKFNKPNQNQK